MSLPLHQRVALKRDLPEHGLRRGNAAVLLNFVKHPEAAREDACSRWRPLLDQLQALHLRIAPRTRVAVLAKAGETG